MIVDKFVPEAEINGAGETAASPCANCSTHLIGNYCHHCGQHRRGSRRLQLREILARTGEHLLDLDSAFLSTFVGLTKRPGEVCCEYIAGRRKRYMNPFGYFVFAGTVSLVSSTVLSWFLGGPPVSGEELG